MFSLTNPVALLYYNWLEDSLVPDEHFFPTLATWNVTRKNGEDETTTTEDNEDYSLEEDEEVAQLQLPIEDLTKFSDEKWMLPRLTIEEKFHLETITYFNTSR